MEYSFKMAKLLLVQVDLVTSSRVEQGLPIEMEHHTRSMKFEDSLGLYRPIV